MRFACFGGDAMLGRAWLIDPSGGRGFVGDVLVAGGGIAAAWTGVDGVPGGCVVVDGAGLVACPEFIDLYAHLREPGYECKESIATGARAGAWGGFTARCCMPNTDPPIASYCYGDALRGRPLMLRQARLIGLSDGRDFVGDILAAGGEIAAAYPVVDGISEGCVVVDAAGLVACGAWAGAGGGFTARCGMPNAGQPIDSESVNGGIESSALAHGGRSVIVEQVAAGHGGRMAALYQFNGGEGA